MRPIKINVELLDPIKNSGNHFLTNPTNFLNLMAILSTFQDLFLSECGLINATQKLS